MAETTLAQNPPPFPDEVIDGWAVRWHRADFRPQSFDDPEYGRVETGPKTGIAIDAQHPDGRHRRKAVRIAAPPTDADLEHARDLLREWLHNYHPLAFEAFGSWEQMPFGPVYVVTAKCPSGRRACHTMRLHVDAVQFEGLGSEVLAVAWESLNRRLRDAYRNLRAHA